MGYISAEDLSRLAGAMKKSSYGRYLLEIAEEELFEGRISISPAREPARGGG
jgi:hypothetical protein